MITGALKILALQPPIMAVWWKKRKNATHINDHIFGEIIADHSACSCVNVCMSFLYQYFCVFVYLCVLRRVFMCTCVQCVFMLALLCFVCLFCVFMLPMLCVQNWANPLVTFVSAALSSRICISQTHNQQIPNCSISNHLLWGSLRFEDFAGCTS